MRIINGTVQFDRGDLHFAEKFGPLAAADMVLDFALVNSHPFIYDTYQLADLLGLQRRDLFKLVRNCERYYRQVSIPKRSGGVRELSVPAMELRWIQRRILDLVLVHFPVSPHATAYRKGQGLSANAAPHCGKKYLLKMDVEDFFGSIRFDKVYTAAFGTARFPKQIGTILTALCCKDDVLPQGAPTSPALSNLVLKWLDDTLGRWCQKRGITYTRYCDDLTFSADRPLYDAYCKAKDLLEREGLTVNEKKTRYVTAASRQTVTGLCVNEKLAVPAPERRRLRQEVYYMLKFGPYNASRHVGFEGSPISYCYHLLGRVQYVLQFDPENRWFCNARDEITLLLPDY